jgi:tetratricopeptide (TPR) repeat protein
VYSNLKPVLEKAGFSAIRADEIQKTGAITKDIVTRLGECDLVIADLTDLNPNVFYELGVRHALRGVGTVMILDEKRTPEIPFDLSAYRVIKFTGDLAGIDALIQALTQFLADDVTDESSRRDNPVHDWFPMLPVNVLENSAQSSTAPLRKTIKQLQDRLSSYEKAYGTDLPGTKSTATPLTAVLAALEDAEQGNLPASLMDASRKAFEERDVVGLLQKIRVVLERNIRLPPTMFLALAGWARVLDMDDVVKAIFDQALQFYPSDSNLKQNYLVSLAHSDAPADRERARQEIAGELSVDISKDSFTGVSTDGLRDDLDLITMLLDSYQRDKMHAEELKLTEKLQGVLPDSTQVLRNYARALTNSQRAQEAMQRHRESLFCPDVDDTSAVWLGNELHNRRRHREACEAYAFACVLDPNDAQVFAHLAEELTIAIDRQLRPLAKKTRFVPLPETIEPESVVELVHCSTSCQNVDAEAADRLRRALERLDLRPPTDGDTPLTRAERIQCAERMYAALQTDLTRQGQPYDFTAQQEDAGDKK